MIRLSTRWRAFANRPLGQCRASPVARHEVPHYCGAQGRASAL